MSTDLGMPQAPAAPLAQDLLAQDLLAPRRQSRHIMVGSVPVGGGAPVSVQSMTTTLTANVNATLQQIAELTASGCQIVRVAVPSQDDAEALPAIAKKSQIPVIADIHSAATSTSATPPARSAPRMSARSRWTIPRGTWWWTAPAASMCAPRNRVR